MWRALHRLGWTHKKSHWQPASVTRRHGRPGGRRSPNSTRSSSSLSTKAARTSSLTRLYGWAPHDQRATGSVPRNHGKNTTLVAALTPDGLHVPWLIEGAMDTETFAWYIAEQLGPTLRPGQVVVLDNLSVHKAASIRQALAARGCALLFLPPYSPGLHADRAGVLQAQSPPARAGRSHPGGAPGGRPPGPRGDYPERCARLVRPRRVRPACSSTMKVALRTTTSTWCGRTWCGRTWCGRVGVKPASSEMTTNLPAA